MMLTKEQLRYRVQGSRILLSYLPSPSHHSNHHASISPDDQPVTGLHTTDKPPPTNAPRDVLRLARQCRNCSWQEFEKIATQHHSLSSLEPPLLGGLLATLREMMVPPSERPPRQPSSPAQRGTCSASREVAPPLTTLPIDESQRRHYLLCADRARRISSTPQELSTHLNHELGLTDQQLRQHLYSDLEFLTPMSWLPSSVNENQLHRGYHLNLMTSFIYHAPALAIEIRGTGPECSQVIAHYQRWGLRAHHLSYKEARELDSSPKRYIMKCWFWGPSRYEKKHLRNLGSRWIASHLNAPFPTAATMQVLPGHVLPGQVLPGHVLARDFSSAQSPSTPCQSTPALEYLEEQPSWSLLSQLPQDYAQQIDTDHPALNSPHSRSPSCSPPPDTSSPRASTHQGFSYKASHKASSSLIISLRDVLTFLKIMTSHNSQRSQQSSLSSIQGSTQPNLDTSPEETFWSSRYLSRKPTHQKAQLVPNPAPNIAAARELYDEVYEWSLELVRSSPNRGDMQTPESQTPESQQATRQPSGPSLLTKDKGGRHLIPITIFHPWQRSEFMEIWSNLKTSPHIVDAFWVVPQNWLGEEAGQVSDKITDTLHGPQLIGYPKNPRYAGLVKKILRKVR